MYKQPAKSLAPGNQAHIRVGIGEGPKPEPAKNSVPRHQQAQADIRQKNTSPIGEDGFGQAGKISLAHPVPDQINAAEGAKNHSLLLHEKGQPVEQPAKKEKLPAASLATFP